MNIAVLWLCVVLSVDVVQSFPFISSPPSDDQMQQARFKVDFASCHWVFDEPCPDSNIKFYLFTRENRNDRQAIFIDDTAKKSNLTSSFFNRNYATKVIIHGYNADMFLTPLIDMKDEYLDRDNYNLFFVDWSALSPGPCYPAAAHNTRHVGKCIAQLVKRIHESGTSDIHLIGFSLGAQVTNYVANKLDFKLKRITGLDPAMPGFVATSKNDRLDESDAKFVDVIHTNALIQGKIERCGHADFFMNGGIIQPGCIQTDLNPAACSHHRAAEYFRESINSEQSFWAWPCSSYISYLLGRCPRNNDWYQIGEDCRTNTRGLFMATTNSISPYAQGQWQAQSMYNKKTENGDYFSSYFDEMGKLLSNFNYRRHLKNIALAQPPSSDWPQTHQLELDISDFDRIRTKESKAIEESISQTWKRRNDKFNSVEDVENRAEIPMVLVANSDSDQFLFPRN